LAATAAARYNCRRRVPAEKMEVVRFVETRLHLAILPQPDDFTCGPTCLHAVYSYFGDSISLETVIAQTPTIQGGGTLAVLLANHALKRGYDATMYTYNLQVFDPTWFGRPVDLRTKVLDRARHLREQHIDQHPEAYVNYIDLGGLLRFEDLTTSLLRGYLKRGIPILTGLSATYLYRCAREYGPKDDYDDVRGHPSGHFVVLCGYDKETRNVLVADPMELNPAWSVQYYEVNIDRLVCAILLGVLTYDANLLILQPRQKGTYEYHAHLHRRQQSERLAPGSPGGNGP
jgi:hypothetical protein